jgi:hypothetical protein
VEGKQLWVGNMGIRLYRLYTHVGCRARFPMPFLAGVHRRGWVRDQSKYLSNEHAPPLGMSLLHVHGIAYETSCLKELFNL